MNWDEDTSTGQAGAETRPTASTSHAIVIPTFNTGDRVIETVRDALSYWSPIWVVVDGSDDGSAETLEDLASATEDLHLIRHPRNLGKGAAVLTGAIAARKAGFTHIMAMDADGQHFSGDIQTLMDRSIANPSCLILGDPIFDESAPAERVHGRKLSNLWADVETLWGGIHDSLFGFRVYPADALIDVMQSTRFARRFDFDVEIAVRLIWRGIRPINIPTPVRYLTADEGGVSQFRYLRDNVLLTWMHTRLFLGSLMRFPLIIFRRLRGPLEA